MNVASLELCRELHDLSRWTGSYLHHYWEGDFQETPRETIVRPAYLGVDDRENQYPAYDLGYLLRKLPQHVATSRLTLQNRSAKHAMDGTDIPLWQVGYLRFDGVYTTVNGNADTPEDAVCSLAIALIKQGVIKPEAGDA